MTGFRLYPEAKHYWSLADYAHVLDIMERLRPKRVLEFGPGSSTLALIEGGAEHIDACEDDPHWEFIFERERTEAHSVVTLRRYDWCPDVSIAGVDDMAYDLALIDGPSDPARRPACIDYALLRCKSVLVPLECAEGGSYLRMAVLLLAQKHDRNVEIVETGLLAGAFALLT